MEKNEYIPKTPENLTGVLGNIFSVKNIPSLSKTEDGRLQSAEFRRFENPIVYPREVVEALRIILNEYTESFDQVVRLRQGSGVYQPANFDGQYNNFGYQIDMIGLSLEEMEKFQRLDPQEIAKILRGRIFEIENSLAMYNLMSGIFSVSEDYSHKSFFGTNLDSAISAWEEFYGKPLVLGTVTEGKFSAMLLSEFGLENPSSLTSQLVRERSGFSGFVGPEELKRLIESGKINNVLLYMRTSYPTSFLKKPDKRVEIPLLEDESLIKALRERAITFNVDDNKEVMGIFENMPNIRFIYDPNLGILFEFNGETYSPSILNDTKEPLIRMGLVYPLTSPDELLTQEEYIDDRGKKRIRVILNQEITNNLGTTQLRAKPAWLHYGGYGHVGGDFSKDDELRHELRRQMKKRGMYVLQPELSPYQFNHNNILYSAIHRVFFAYDPQKREYRFVGGLFNALPINSVEAQKGRIHGNGQAVWGQIITRDENAIFDPNSLNFI